jgi:hypothetical protein
MFFVILLPPHMEDCGGREAQIGKYDYQWWPLQTTVNIGS